MATYAEQIGAFEAKLASNVATMKSLMDAASEKGETLDAEAQDQFDELQAENESVEKHLSRLRDMEKLSVAKAADVTDATSTKAADAVRGPVATVKGPNLPKGTAFTRYAMALMAGVTSSTSASYIWAIRRTCRMGTTLRWARWIFSAS